MKTIIGIIIGVIVAVLGSLGINQANLGGASGVKHTNLEFFQAGLVGGGEVVTKTGASTTTLTAADVCNNGTVVYASAVAGATTTFPTAANLTASCLKRNGDTKTIIFRNTGATATATVYFVAGSGNTMYIPEATGADVAAEGLNAAIVTFVRTSSSAVRIFVQEMLVQ